MQLKQICREILKEAKKSNTKDLKKFNNIKLKILNKYNYKQEIPKNATIASLASEKDRKNFKNILSMKPVRTISGVAPLALMTDPYPCPHAVKGIGPCTYCPGGPGSPFGNVPQSYTGKEPSTRRAIRNHYDPYLGVFNRLEHYIAMNSVPEKADIILQGGTFNFFPYSYQEYFVKYLFKAMNDFSRLFYPKNNLDLKKFNQFFEMPADVKDNERTERIQKKLLFIKNLDLNNKKNLVNINNLFFKNNFNKNNNTMKQWINFSKKIKNSSIFKLNNENQNITTSKNPNRSKLRGIFTPENGYEKPKQSFGVLNPFSLNKNFNGKNKNNANAISMKLVLQKVKEQNNPKIELEKEQKANETAKIRCVGLTIETRADYGKLKHGNEMLKLGCTRVELGIQTIYDDVLKKINRGHSVKDNIDSIRILKDLGFKINLHYMPGLPKTTKEMDRKGLKDLFKNPDYKPDMLKIYPCMVMTGTKLYKDWKNEKFKPLTTKEAAEMIAWAKQFVPEYCRIMRVQRDIPTFLTSSGVDRTNLRQYVDKICKEKRIKCNCIRCREISLNKRNIDLKSLKINVIEYNASNGKEFFIQAIDKNHSLFGFCRLRFPSQFLRKEITKTSSLIRELHVYSLAVSIGKKSKESFQHRGIGKKLLKEAEKIAKKNNKNKMVVISGIGAKQYFSKLGYTYDGLYMSKKL